MAAHQAPPSMRFSRQESWSGVSLPSPCPQRNPLFWIFYNNYSCLVEKLINGITQYMLLCFNIFEIHPYHYIYQYFVSYYFWEIQFSSVASNSVTPWIAAHQASLSITKSRSLLKFMCIELAMLSNHLILCCPLLLLLSISPSIRVFSNESAVLIRWPQDWSFSFSISPSN